MLRPLLSFLLASAFALPALAGQTITLSSGEWQPYISQQAKQQGVVSHIVREAFAAEGVSVNYVFRPWKRALEEARAGEVAGSIIWGPGTNERERARDFYFSDTVIEGRSVFFHLKSTPFNWATYEDLVTVKIGGTAGYLYRFERDPRIQIDRAASDELSFRKLLAGRFQIFPSDLYGGQAVLDAHFTPEEAAQITHHPLPYSITGYHLLLSRKLATNSALLAKFNSGLRKLHASGRYDQMIEAFQRGDYRQR